MYTCNHCRREFESISSLAAHISHCKNNPNKKRTQDSYIENLKKGLETQRKQREEYKKLHPYEYEIKDFVCSCKKCGKAYHISATQKQFDLGKYRKNCSTSCANKRNLTEETKKKISNGVKSSEKFIESCNRRRTLEQKVYKCNYCGKSFMLSDERDTTSIKYCSSICKHNYLSEHSGGYRKGSGRGKSGWYKGVHCDSTWELAFLIYHIDNGLYIKRCTERRKYLYNGIEHFYYPDFITDEGIIEIKGYNNPQWEEKHEQNKDIKVLYKIDIKKYLDYAESKYGRPLELMYDGINPNKILNIEEKKNVWVNNGIVQKYIDSNLYDEYIKQGYIHGRLK